VASPLRPLPFALNVFFRYGVTLLPVVLDFSLSTSVPHTAGVTGVCHHAWQVFNKGLCFTLPWRDRQRDGYVGTFI
jgi:hypothetical protein